MRYELRQYAEKNRAKEANMQVSPAILADNQKGVAIFFGTHNMYLSIDGAMKLATGLADAIEAHKRLETKP